MKRLLLIALGICLGGCLFAAGMIVQHWRSMRDWENAKQEHARFVSVMLWEITDKYPLLDEERAELARETGWRDKKGSDE